MEIPEFKGSFVVENHGTPQPKQNAILVMPLVLASNKSLLLVSELYTTLVRDIKYIEKITINTEAYCARDYIESCAESFSTCCIPLFSTCTGGQGCTQGGPGIRGSNQIVIITIIVIILIIVITITCNRMGLDCSGASSVSAPYTSTPSLKKYHNFLFFWPFCFNLYIKTCPLSKESGHLGN